MSAGGGSLILGKRGMGRGKVGGVEEREGVVKGERMKEIRR